jgi:hypothetical protein
MAMSRSTFETFRFAKREPLAKRGATICGAKLQILVPAPKRSESSGP